MGDCLERALTGHVSIVRFEAVGDLATTAGAQAPGVVIVKGTGRMLGAITAAAREHLRDNPLVILIDDSDPRSFLFRVHDPVIWRRPITLSDIVEIASSGLGEDCGQLAGRMTRGQDASASWRIVQREAV
jgi:hypothetical protein